MAANGSLLTLNSDLFNNVIDNQLVSTEKTRNSVDPSTGTPLPPVPLSTTEDVDRAVIAARKAFPSWRKTPWDERAALINIFADAIEANKAFLREWLIKEIGKPAQATDAELAISLVAIRGIAALRIEEEVVEDTEERRAKVRYVPVGVGAALVPWNWPLALCVGKVASALLTGNTLIMKPSPFTPYTDLKIAELASHIFPPGVLQAVSGDESLGPLLTAHPDIDIVSFTGSTQTGKKVMQSCSHTLKRVILELGGNDAAIVCEDVDFAVAIPKIAALAFLTSGQTCMNIKRIYIHASIYNEFRDAFVAHVRDNLKIGPASDETVFIGPVQNAGQYDRVASLYGEIDKQGWTAALGGSDSVCPRENGEGGYFIKPVIIDNPPDDSRVVVEEPFGPIVPLLRWSSEEEVIGRANSGKDGLGASVWTSDLDRGERIASELETGSVWVNSHFELSPAVPFGGHKWSGMGMEWGVVGLKAWCNPQSQWVRRK